MKSRTLILSIAATLLLALLSPLAGATDLEWSVAKQFSLDVRPLDVAPSGDGQWLYILTPGEVQVYSLVEDKVIKRIPVEKDFDQVSFVASSQSLVLSGSTKALKILHLEPLYTFDNSGLAALGPANARVTIVVFSDYQCPFCKQLFPVLRAALKDNPKDVRLVVKSFPLPSHKFAQSAAVAALAALKQGKFWEYHDQLFENMSSLSDEKVLQIATGLGLDLEKFRRDLKDEDLKKDIVRDVAEGNGAHVTGTPTVFVNGKLLRTQTAAGLQGAIDEVLAKK